jgi:hypothetical protein
MDQLVATEMHLLSKIKSLWNQSCSTIQPSSIASCLSLHKLWHAILVRVLCRGMYRIERSDCNSPAGRSMYRLYEENQGAMQRGDFRYAPVSPSFGEFVLTTFAVL